MGTWGPRGTNLLDGGAHFYNVYETSDGAYVSLAAYEPQFYANFLRLVGPLGFDDLDPAAQMDMAQWPALKTRLAALFRTKSRDEWVAFFEGTEVCFAPVLPMSEARASAQRRARDVRRRCRRVAARAGTALQSHDDFRAGCTGKTWCAHALPRCSSGASTSKKSCTYRERRDRVDSQSPDTKSSQVTPPGAT